MVQEVRAATGLVGEERREGGVQEEENSQSGITVGTVRRGLLRFASLFVVHTANYSCTMPSMLPPLPLPSGHAKTRLYPQGPAILIQDVSTVVVEPGCIATVTPFGDVAIEVGEVGGSTVASGGGGGRRKNVGVELDPVYLSIFAHRFMGIAEQMGRTLQVRNGSTAVELL